MSQSNKFALSVSLSVICSIAFAQSTAALVEKVRRESQGRIDAFEAVAKDALEETQTKGRSTTLNLAKTADLCLDNAAQKRQISSTEVTLIKQISKLSKDFREEATAKTNSIKSKQETIDSTYKNYCSSNQSDFSLYLDCTARYEKMHHMIHVVHEIKMISFYADRIAKISSELENCVLDKKNLSVMLLDQQKKGLIDTYAELSYRTDRLNELSNNLIYK